MDHINLIARIICTGAGITFLLAIIATQVMAYEPEQTTVYLTKEEWENRPVMQVEHKHIDAEPIEELQTEEHVFKVYDEIPLEPFFQTYMQEMCQTYHVGFAFALAMMESESSFNTDAIGDSGRSRGLMQINRPNWNRYDLDASMVYDNIEIGVRMMGELIEKYSEFDAVVMAYKGGEAKADEWIASGFRLSACDTLAERTIYWQEIIDKN